MTSSNYRRGADAERRAVAELRHEGWPHVTRAAGSKGPFDVLALGPGGGLCVQVKRSVSGWAAHGRALADLVVAARHLPANVVAELWVHVPRCGFRRVPAPRE
jgi:Holliday junction resolvase